MKTWTPTQLSNAEKFNLDIKLPYKDALTGGIRRMIEQRGGTLLQGIYEKNTSPLLIQCEKGHQFDSYWNRLSKGIWCAQCSGTAKLTLQDAREAAEEKKGTLLSTDYKNSRSKLLWKCSEGHEFPASLSKVKDRGQWCPQCNGNLKPEIQDVRQFASQKGGELLTEVYDNSQSDMRWKCEQGHQWTANWSTIKRGHWCPYCAGLARVSIHTIRDIITERGGTLLSEKYDGNKAKLEIKCNTCEIAWKARWNNIYNQNQWCPNCNFTGTSKVEQELVEWIRSELPTDTEILSNDRKLITPYELDAYLPSLNFAVEFHGLYWHSARNNKKDFRIKYQKKYMKCQEQGVSLVQVFEDEWRLKPEIVKSMIRARLGTLPNKISARACEIQEVPLQEARSFQEENHIAGGVKSHKAFGLYFEDKLVSILSLRTPFTTNKKGALEISRFCSVLNTKIPGAFQKLLKRTVHYLKTEGKSQLYTYSDCRFGKGNVYLQAGFNYIGRTEPNYFYEKRGIRESRFSHRKNNDPDFITQYGNTEREQNHSQGWFEIYDAGSEIYVLNLNN